MSEYTNCYRCNLCNEEYWSANETVVTIQKKEYKKNEVATRVWEFSVCDECLKKLLEWLKGDER